MILQFNTAIIADHHENYFYLFSSHFDQLFILIREIHLDPSFLIKFNIFLLFLLSRFSSQKYYKNQDFTVNQGRELSQTIYLSLLINFLDYQQKGDNDLEDRFKPCIFYFLATWRFYKIYKSMAGFKLFVTLCLLISTNQNTYVMVLQFQLRAKASSFGRIWAWIVSQEAPQAQIRPILLRPVILICFPHLSMDPSLASPFNFNNDIEVVQKQYEQDQYLKFCFEDSQVRPDDIESYESKVESSCKNPAEEISLTAEQEDPKKTEPKSIFVHNKIRKSEGCQCSKIGCKKGYCSCFQNGVKCGVQCGCRNCDNHRFVKYIRVNIEDFSLSSFDYRMPKQIRKY